MNALVVLGLLKLFAKVTAGECRSNKCLAGKTAIVTGATSSIGFVLAKALAARGCTVYLTGFIKVPPSAMENLRLATGNPRMFYDVLDLSDFANVRTYVGKFKERESRLDILMNNWNTIGNPPKVTNDNLLEVMQCNHLSPFLMTHLLSDLLKATPKSRVVFDGHLFSYIPTLTSAKAILRTGVASKNPLQNFIAYNNSKICSCICANGFAQRFKQYGVACNVAYPGFVNEENRKVHNSLIGGQSIRVELTKIISDVFAYVYSKTLFEGIQTGLLCAQGKTLDGVSGKFFVDCRSVPMPLSVRRRTLSKDVWSLSEQVVGLKDHEKLT